jgi:hypothetical protein
MTGSQLAPSAGCRKVYRSQLVCVQFKYRQNVMAVLLCCRELHRGGGGTPAAQWHLCSRGAGPAACRVSGGVLQGYQGEVTCHKLVAAVAVAMAGLVCFSYVSNCLASHPGRSPGTKTPNDHVTCDVWAMCTLRWRRAWTSSAGCRSEAMTCCRQLRCQTTIQPPPHTSWHNFSSLTAKEWPQHHDACPHAATSGMK